VERANKIPKWQGDKSGLMLINMEWGGFGSGSHTSSNQMLPFHGVDESLDAASPNEGKQRFEKMIGGMYLGEISRLLIEHLITHGAILVDESHTVRSPTSASASNGSIAVSPPSAPGSPSNSLHRKGGFTTEDMSNVAGDTTAMLDGVANVLSTKGVSISTLEDRRLIQEMCSLVACRAARMSAMGVAAIALHMGTDADNCSAAIDGSVFKLYPNFQKWMNEALEELGVNVKLTFAEDGSGKGAALVGLVASKSTL
jgi:hexokinase